MFAQTYFKTHFAKSVLRNALHRSVPACIFVHFYFLNFSTFHRFCFYPNMINLIFISCLHATAFLCTNSQRMTYVYECYYRKFAVALNQQYLSLFCFVHTKRWMYVTKDRNIPSTCMKVAVSDDGNTTNVAKKINK